MDGLRFDEMARAASRRDSRRSVTRAVAGAALVALGLTLPGGEIGAAPCRHNQERCGGRCRAKCPDVMLRNRRTCQCDCPDGMTRCGRICVGADRCCPGEKECGGGCIAETSCCTHTHKECPDGSCLPRDAGACCPGVEAACASSPGGCCNTFAGEECSDDGCCNVLLGQAVCGGNCIDTTNDPKNCGGCGVACARCEVCEDGACRGPDRTPPACEGCVNGEVKPGTDCGGRCCGPGAECCGGGCCEPGKCRVQNGQPCCLRVIDNRLICLRM